MYGCHSETFIGHRRNNGRHDLLYEFVSKCKKSVANTSVWQEVHHAHGVLGTLVWSAARTFNEFESKFCKIIYNMGYGETNSTLPKTPPVR